MPEPRPAEDRSQPASSLENVVFLASSSITPAVVPASTESKVVPDPKPQSPYYTDGSATIKTGGMPPAAWQSSAAELAKLLVGKQLGSFRIDASLGTGGMAAVFQAVDSHLDRKVALKILPPLLAAQIEHVQRFEREAKVAAQLDHENVARVHLYGQDQGLHYIAYEFVDGINLRDLIDQQGGKLPVADAVDFLLQASQGLAHTAARGIIHRDIKPSNLVITNQGKVKLVDLGLARNSMEESQDALTQSGATLGTFDYLAPEQAIDPRLADVRSDIYSLGCTFYHALTGQPPVPEGTAARKLQSHQLELPRSPSELNPEIPQPVVDVLSKMLAKRPEDRYQTADELVRDVQRLKSTFIEPTQAYSAIHTDQSSRSIPWYVSLLGMIGLIGTIILWDTLWRDNIPHADAALVKQYTETAPTENDRQAVRTTTAEKVTGPITQEIETVDELINALKRPLGGTLVLKRSVYEIRGGNNLKFNAGEWTLKAADGQRATLRLLDSASAVMMDVKAGSLRLQQLNLVIQGLETTVISAQPQTQIILDQCECIREASNSIVTGGTANPAAIIRINNSSDSLAATTVEVKGSIWHPSAGIGLLFDGPGYVHFDECWIAPQYQFIVMPALSQLNSKRIVNIKQSAIAMASDACFKVAGRSPIFLELEHSIVSKLSSSMSDDSTLLVVDDKAQVDLQSYDSMYHRIATLCSLQRANSTREILARDWRQLKQAITHCKEEGTIQVSRYPWQELKPWQRYLESQKPATLALRSEYSSIGPANLLGSVIKPGSSEAGGTATSSSNKTSRALIVDGHGDEPGTFSTLNSALGSIADEEETVIQLQVHGTIPVKTSEIGNSKVVIKAGEGYRPELTFHRDTVAGPDGEAHLFRLHDGELTLENVRVRLESLRDPAKSLNMVVVTGVGKCKIKDSIITLKGTNDLLTTVYAVGDPTGILSPAGNKTARVGSARLECIDALIRGIGQVLNVQTSRPFSMQLSQCGVALDGTLITLEGNRGDMAMPADTASLQLERSTCYSTRGLLHLRSTSSMPQLMALRCTVNQSIIATGDQQPMVRFDVQQADSDLKRRLFWQGKRNIYLTSASTMMSYQQIDRDTMATLYDSTLWSEFWGNDDEQAQIVKSINALSGISRQVTLADWETTDFAVRLENGNTFSMRDMGLPMEAMPRTNGQMP